MNFKSIKIKNVFSYCGSVSFNFQQGENPVTLIVGENGFGKTSFINSLKIALHGISKDVLSVGGQLLSKEDFVLGNPKKNFSGILNRTAKRDGENVASIEVVIETGAEIVTVVRTYSLKKNDYTETIVLLDEDGSVIAEGEDAQDMINQKISPTMAKFFIFDGEKIQTISDFSHDEFTQMLEDVLELDIYDKIVSDSERIILNINKEAMSDDLKAGVEKKEDALRSIAAELVSKRELKKEKTSQINRLEKEKNSLMTSLLENKSKYAKELEESLLLYEVLVEEKEELTENLKQATLGELPLLLNPALAASVFKDVEDNYTDRAQIPPAVLDKKKSRMTELLSAFMDREKASEIFAEVFDQDGESSVPFADAKHVSRQVSSFSGGYLPMLLSSLSSLSHEIQKAISEANAIEQKMIEENSGLGDIKTRISSLSGEVASCLVDLETLSRNIIALEEEEKELGRELAKLSIQEHKNEVSATKIKTLQSIIYVAGEMKKEIKKSKRAALESSINAKFGLLRKQGYEADRLTLDENFNVGLYDEEGRPMDILSSSSGQKQIIATALIWGISEFIGEDIPMVIDTPLGRLDEKNQSLILEKFYPHVSSQVIILPTPSEIKHEGFLQLSRHVSEVYILSNAGSATTVRTTDVDNVLWVARSNVIKDSKSLETGALL